ncbi:hypothetical protein [Microvirga puerhi]|uniref:Uncharacterized protein n=1 Tax=Microvirga puerhi TaxID=2876078 RepID=A0ABS7VUN8_9HYPH|nr:hypothetical protein [Microvirga puerhi]MBZ6078835.1 hypothetical protein [Microvirga puerhi]
MSTRNCIVISFCVWLLAPGAKAQDGGYGCQVILCLSNPGGATQYAECVPPITKLYQDLAQGKPFPACTGAGVETSAPVSDPYFCKGSHVLDFDNGYLCRSQARTVTVDCPKEDTDTPRPPLGGPVKDIVDGQEVCKDFEFSQVQVYEKKSYIDVRIPSTGKSTRIRF